MKFPKIIQGGMGAGVSTWRLARAVASQGQMGVVSGTALDLILARRLQMGDPGGHMQRALAAFPDQNISKQIIDRYFIDGGKQPDQPFAVKPILGHKLKRHLEELLIAGNFVEVYLAKEGHEGMVGINYLFKIQTPHLPSIYGAMLAGVDVVIVGAGIPFEIPRVLDNLQQSAPTELKLYVKDAKKGSDYKLHFNPENIVDGANKSLKRPYFFPIVSSNTLAAMMLKKCKGQVDGLVIEGPSAGGHNAPPRGQMKLTSEGEPIYGPRDEVDLAKIKSLGLPFWLAGSYGDPKKLLHARNTLSAGVQVGTLFAFCEESGLRDDIKKDMIKRCQYETPRVFTDPVVSPAGFPFKVLSISGTLSDPGVFAKRTRLCDLGYLREAYAKPDGSLGWRCPAEITDKYVKKGGNHQDTIGRKCVCNGLMANIGMAQVRSDNSEELPLVTCGDDLSNVRQISRSNGHLYTASDVIDFLLAEH